MKLTELDKKILVLTQLDARMSIRRIASLAGCRPHRARYVIEKLLGMKVISHYTFVNPFAVRLMPFGLYLSTAFSTEDGHRLLIERVRNSSRASWAFEISGRYQYLITFFAQALGDVYEFLHNFDPSVRFINKALACRLEWYNFPCKYLFPELKEVAGLEVRPLAGSVSIDSTDALILSKLTLNCAWSQAQIARSLGLPASTVSHRLLRLEKEGVIRALAYWINCSSFGVANYRLLVAERGSDPGFKQKLLAFCRQHPHVVGFVHCLGSWDFEIRIEVFEPVQVNNLIQELYSLFGRSIESIEAIQVLTTIKTVAFPAELFPDEPGKSRK